MSADFSDGQIYVDFTHTDNAAEDMRMQTRQIEKILSDLERDLQKFVASWEGDDQAAYVEKQKAWDQAVNNMRTLLDSHAMLLNDISKAYQDNQRQLTQSWQDVKIGR